MVEAVRGTRGLTRSDLARNRATAPIEIDPSDGRVTLAGRRLAVEPVRTTSRCTAGTGCAERAQAQMSPMVKPSGNGSVGSTT